MTVAFDAVGPSSSGAGIGANTSLSWTHTVGTGPAVLLVEVGLGVTSGIDGPFAITATCDGVSMTRIAGPLHINNSTFGFISVFAVSGLASGAHSIVATATGGTPDALEGGSLSFTGASGSFGTVYTGAGSSGTATASVAATTSGNMVATFLGCGNAMSSATSPSTNRFYISQHTSCCGNVAGATSPSTGSAVTTAWSITSDYWGVISLEVLAATAFSGSPTISVALDASATGFKAASGSSTLSVALDNSASGHKTGIGSPTLPVALGASATGFKAASGSSTLSLALSYLASGLKHVSRAVSVALGFGASATTPGSGQLCQRIDSGDMTPVLISPSLILDRSHVGTPPARALCWQVSDDPLNEGQYLLQGWLNIMPVFDPGALN